MMPLASFFSLYILLSTGILASFLRVETGHQNIAIDGRDPYMGFFTRILFHEPTCISSLTIHCLCPLTGAEEIDILFSDCVTEYWKVGHYTNTKEKFRLKKPVVARQLSISSPSDLTIIDVQVESCTSSIESIPLCPSRDHLRRHGKTGPLRATEYERKRRKRTIPSTENLEFDIVDSPYNMISDTIVYAGQRMTIYPGVTMRFAPGTGITVYGVLVVNGTMVAPVHLEGSSGRWRGIEIVRASFPSFLYYLNVSGSDLGVTVKGGIPPRIDHVISDSNGIGFDLNGTSTSSEIRITKSSAVNNDNAGFRITGKAGAVIDSCLAASNRENGFRVDGAKRVTFVRSHSFSNSLHGIMLINMTTVTVDQTLISANGASGLKIFKVKGIQLNVKLLSMNISGHYYGPAVKFDDSANILLLIRKMKVHDNHNGAVLFGGWLDRSQVSIESSNFSRNRGSTISITALKKGSLTIYSNSFEGNQLKEFTEKEAVIHITTMAEGSDSSVRIENNQFEQNAMNVVVKVRHLRGNAVPVLISRNNFLDNLAYSVVEVNVPKATVSGNFFNNVQSSCEIIRPVPNHSDSVLNHWGYDIEAEILSRICSINNSQLYESHMVDNMSSLLSNYLAETAKNPLPEFGKTYNQVKAMSKPYTIESDVTVKADEIVIIESGSHFDISSKVGFIIQERGKMYFNGTNKNPVWLYGASPWTGIVVKPGGTLILNYVIIENASTGVWIDSDKVEIKGAMIINPTIHGVEITANSATEVDLGHSMVEQAGSTAVVVDERNSDIIIRNLVIKDSNGSGIDFFFPIGDIQIENVKVINASSFSIHLAESSPSSLHTVSIKNVSITNQAKGHAGLLISGSWIQNLTIDGSLFNNNSVPSLILGLECRDHPFLITIRNSLFTYNNDTVIHLHMGECAGLEMKDNLLEENNRNGEQGVLILKAQPKKMLDDILLSIKRNKFLTNHGEYVASLSMEESNKMSGIISENLFEDNLNSDAVLIVTSPYFHIINNTFSNPNSKYQTVLRGNSNWKLAASGNEWGSTIANDVEQRSHISSEMSIHSTPSSDTMGNALVEEMKKNATNIGIVTPLNMQCSHLNYCSNRGTCMGGICFCPVGFLGFDCSIAVGCAGNCSNNGICNLFNKCVCFEGWSSVDCSQPLCRYDCSGHGKCVSKDECECDVGWTGQFCASIACQEATCIHGKCNESVCQCEEGWKGSRCAVPVCSNCTLNGLCVEPELCHCFRDYGGPDCSVCDGPSCNSCDFDCEHGSCEPITRTCSCSRGWTGGACDVCSTTNCPVKSSVLYILPSTADQEDTNTVVNVYGIEFPKTSSGVYICIFGSLSSEGRRVTSSLVRCPLPVNVTLGRHLFNIAPQGSISVIPNLDVRPIHFTVFERCLSSICQGFCLGPLCICPVGITGLRCDVIGIVPSIDRRFIENQNANSATEGTPYVVVLPTMPDSVYRINSSIPNLHFDSSRGILEWAEPVGADKPYEITVIYNSLSGESSLSWNMSASPSYTAELTSVNKVPNTSRMMILGRIERTVEKEKGPTSVPIRLKIREEASKDAEEIILASDTHGQFSYEFTPKKEGKYGATVSHPGVSLTSSSITFSVPLLQFTARPTRNSSVYLIADVNDCEATLITPSNGSLQFKQGRGGLLFLAESPGWNGEIVSSVQCDGNRKELFRHYPQPLGTPGVYAIPSSIAIVNQGNKSKTFEVTIYTSGVYLRSPMSIRTADNTQPFFLIATDPDIDKITENSNYHHIKISLGLNVAEEFRNGSIEIVSGREVLLRIPYVYLSMSSDRFDVTLCLRDGTHAYGVFADATIVLSVTNTALGVDYVRDNLRIEDSVKFSLMEGFYQIAIKSSNHRPFSELIFISPLNTSFCITLQAIDIRSIPAEENEILYMSELKEGHITTLPHVEFSPSSVNSSTESIIVRVKGTMGGLVSVDNVDNSFVRLTPSVRSSLINDSFWIFIEWKKNVFISPCTARIISIPLLFLPENTTQAVEITADLIVTGDKRETSWELCNEVGTPRPHAVRTRVLCDCGQGSRAKCRRQYRSAAICGPAWHRIPDDTVSIQILATFLLLLADCQAVHVDLREINQAMQCISSIESECPILHKKKRLVDPMIMENYMLNDGPADIIKHLSSVNGRVSGVLQPMFPILNALDMQSIRMASLFSDFIDKLNIVFPLELFDGLDRKWIDRFLVAITDISESGNLISTKEKDEIGDSELIDRWNNTVTEWTSGQTQNFMGRQETIPYSDAKQLVVSADRLKSLTRQNGATDPFSLMHNYIGRILATTGNEDESCLLASVLIDPLPLEEDDSVFIHVYINNLKDVALTNIDLSLDFLRNDPFSPLIQFGIGPSWSSGINNLNGFGVLGPHSSFEIHWSRKIISTTRLTTTAHYQAVVLLTFLHNGHSTKQRLRSTTMLIQPRKSIRVLHFVNGEIGPKVERDFSLMTTIMNIGYSSLSNVRIEALQLDVLSGDLPAHFDIIDLKIDGVRTGNSLTLDVGDIPSGISKKISYNIITQNKRAQISNISSVLSVDGKIAPVEDVHIYLVRAALDEKEGFLVSSLGESEPYYFFRPDSGSIVNVVPLQFISSKVESTKNPYRVKVEAIFKNLESPGFSGSLWASLPLPEIPEQYRLIKMIDRRGSRQRILQPVSWIDQNRTLHIIDSSAAFPVSEITYDLVFANPREMQMPSFEQSIYRVQVMPEAWPSVGSIIANLAAHSPDGHPLTYSLYSPDNEKLFSVDHNTGDLFIESSVPSGDEFCLVLIARDDNGQETRVPVVVNTGGPRKECVLFATDGLSPIIHQSSKTAITTKVQWTSSTIRPKTEPFETTDDFMTPPVLSISPDISPETISTTITITPTMSLTTSTLSAIHPMSSIQTNVQTTSILHEEMTTNLPSTEDMEIHTITPDKTLLPMTTTIAITEFSELPLTLTENKTTSKTSVETEAPSSTTTWIIGTQENTDKFPTPPTVQLPNELETTTTNYIVTNEATVIYSISSDANEPTTEVPITTTPATIIYTVSSESPLWMITDGTKEPLLYQTSTEHLYTVTPDYTLLTTLTMTEPVRTTTEYIYTASEEPKPVTTNESIGLPIVIPTESSQTSFSTVKTMIPSTIRSVLSSSTPYAIVSIPTTKKITEDACVKSGLSIWKLICDLSKTAKQKGF